MVKTTPDNINPLRLTGYQFGISKIPTLPFFVQSVAVPEISLGIATHPTSLHDLKVPGGTIEYDNLSIEFIVDEEMKNWNAIYHWMIALGYPTSHDLYKKFVESSKNMGLTELAKGFSDGFLTVLDNANRSKQTFTFVDMFPISLQGLRYDSSQQEQETAIATAQFAYSYYYINKEPTNY